VTSGTEPADNYSKTCLSCRLLSAVSAHGLLLENVPESFKNVYHCSTMNVYVQYC
jgi:hypothetical protein